MKSMKRLFVLALALVMLAACFACKKNNGANATPAPTQEAQANTPKPTDVPTPEPTEEPTPEPTEVPLMQGDLDDAFAKLNVGLAPKKVGTYVDSRYPAIAQALK